MMPNPDFDPEKLRIRHQVEQVVHDEEPDLYCAFALELLAAVRRVPGPDFSRRAKQVVQRWFERGLSGKKLAEVGKSLLGAAFPTYQVNPNQHGLSEV